MTEITRETVTTESGNEAAVNRTTGLVTSSQTIEYLVYFFFGILEVFLVFRLVLKLIGASVSSTFVGFIYGLSKVFIWPFEGIFRKGFAQGVETTSVFEPSTLVAIVVYALIAIGVVKLIRILSGEKQA